MHNKVHDIETTTFYLLRQDYVLEKQAKNVYEEP